MEKSSKDIKKDIYNKPNLMDRKTPWTGSLDFPETDNISNNPKNINAGDLIVWKGVPLSQGYLRSIDEDARDEIAKDLLNFFLKYDFINDYKYSDKELQSAWNRLIQNKSMIKEADGTKILVNVGTTGYKLYRHFFPNIIKTRGANRNSIYDVLTDKELLWKVLRNRIGNTLLYGGEENKDLGYLQFPMPITPSQITIGAKNSGLASMGSIYKPLVAKTIYQQYVKEDSVVLDYSCGFGTRLIGLMACGFKNVKYIGYEPNTETYNNLITMSKYFGFNVDIKCCGSEDEVFIDKVDFAFSSPPYYDAEIYCNEASQSINKFPEYNDWLNGYWRKTVQNIKFMLKDDGMFGINVGGMANEKMQKLEQDVAKIIEEEGFKLIDTIYMKTSKSHLSAKKGNDEKKFKLESTFFYRKE
jgi:hypothetical protein